MGYFGTPDVAPLRPGQMSPGQPVAGDPGALNLGDYFNQFGGWLDETVHGKKFQTTPGAGAIDQTQGNQSRGAQMALLAQLQAQAAGRGPSLAQMQLQQATDQNMQQAMSMGLSSQAQGMNPGSALRAASRARAGIQGQSAAQSAMLRLMEQQQAQQQLAGLSTNMRGQDLGVAGQQAGLDLNRQGQEAAIHKQNNPGWGAEIAAVGQALPVIGGMFNPKGGGGGNQLHSSVSQGSSMAQPEFTGLYPQMRSGGSPVGGNHGLLGYAHGGPVDSPQNDTVPAMLSPGEIVLPVSVAQAVDAPERAAAFVEMIRREHRAKPPLKKRAA